MRGQRARAARDRGGSSSCSARALRLRQDESAPCPWRWAQHPYRRAPGCAMPAPAPAPARGRAASPKRARHGSPGASAQDSSPAPEAPLPGARSKSAGPPPAQAGRRGARTGARLASRGSSIRRPVVLRPTRRPPCGSRPGHPPKAASDACGHDWPGPGALHGPRLGLAEAALRHLAALWGTVGLHQDGRGLAPLAGLANCPSPPSCGPAEVWLWGPAAFEDAAGRGCY